MLKKTVWFHFIFPMTVWLQTFFETNHPFKKWYKCIRLFKLIIQNSLSLPYSHTRLGNCPPTLLRMRSWGWDMFLRFASDLHFLRGIHRDFSRVLLALIFPLCSQRSPLSQPLRCFYLSISLKQQQQKKQWDFLGSDLRLIVFLSQLFFFLPRSESSYGLHF